jgi:ABC-type transporter MlaC component
MKKLIILSTLVFAANAINAQKLKEAELPQKIKESFSKDFKEAKAAKWEKEKDGNYEAEFMFNKIEMSVTYNTAGDLLETESEIAVADLPKTVSEYVAKNFPGKKIKEASKIIEPDGSVKYEAEVSKKDLIFDSAGNFIK